MRKKFNPIEEKKKDSHFSNSSDFSDEPNSLSLQKSEEIVSQNSFEPEDKMVLYLEKSENLCQKAEPLREIGNEKPLAIKEKEESYYKEEKKVRVDEMKEIKHFQFDLFENGRFNKVFSSMQEIGKGGFGEVYKATHKIENAIYAIKKVYLPVKINEDIRDHKYFREVMSMTKFNHKNVVRLHIQFFLNVMMILDITLPGLKNLIWISKNSTLAGR